MRERFILEVVVIFTVRLVKPPEMREPQVYCQIPSWWRIHMMIPSTKVANILLFLQTTEEQYEGIWTIYTPSFIKNGQSKLKLLTGKLLYTS